VPPLAGGGSNPVSAAINTGTSTQEGNQIRNPSGMRVKSLQGVIVVQIPHTLYHSYKVSILVPLDLSKDTKPYTMLRSPRSIQLGSTSGSSNTNQNPQNMAFISSNSTSSTNEADTTASGVSTAHTQELETISLDDLYNNLKIYEPELLGSLNINQNPQNMAFVSSNSTSSTYEADTTASGVSTTHTQGTTINSTSVDNHSDAVICAFLVSQPNSPQLAKEDLEQIDPDDLVEMDLH
nr:hypothetical protein [Tanacetum cinerariifolium]